MNADPFTPLSPAPAFSSVPEWGTPQFEDTLLLTVEEVQKHLRRSRASVYRYANTDPEYLNPPFDPQKLNPEVRLSKHDPLLFHPKEVRRFGRDVLGLNPTIEVQTPPETTTHELLKAILAELQSIHTLLKSRS
jgi:hypothetical protein